MKQHLLLLLTLLSTSSLLLAEKPNPTSITQLQQELSAQDNDINYLYIQVEQLAKRNKMLERLITDTTKKIMGSIKRQQPSTLSKVCFWTIQIAILTIAIGLATLLALAYAKKIKLTDLFNLGR